MSGNDWKAIVKHYAKGKPICNCENAYYTLCGKGFDREGNLRTDLPACTGGCDCNQILCRNEIAKQIINDLKITQ